jgi:hypothetical protein
MPTETRLLYIFSDLAYIAKLNPTKKAHEFAISDFHQLNGQFLDENSLIEKNIKKLVDKLEAGSYQLILPDFLFTNTMVNVEVKTEEEVKEYLKDQLLPDLKIDTEDFYLDTNILSNYGGAFKVQLTALEKGIILPLVKALKNSKDVSIQAVAPLSFSIKSLISLEPSVSILQVNRELYLAQHYIGVDQCFNTSIDNANDFAETVKTLKGVEPSLQTLYLLSDALVDNKIKEVLTETLPVQQLAEPAEEGDKIPPYVKKIIEAGAKTLSIPDYLLPQFSIDQDYDKELAIQQEKEDDLDSTINITKPAVVGEEETKESKLESENDMKNKEPKKKEEAKQDSKKIEDQEKAKKEVLPSPKKIDLTEVNKPSDQEQELQQKTEDSLEKAEKKEEAAEINLAQFTNLAVDPSVLNKKEAKKTSDKESEMPSVKPVIKNSSEGTGVLKMIIIALLSFALTVALGVGIGYGVLQLTNKQVPEINLSNETAETTEEPEPSPTPEPVEINKEDYQLLVVNATTKAGYAGTIANDLEEAGFVDVAADNASGEYEEGNYLLLSDLAEEQEASNQALLAEIEEITELDWQLSDEITVEDADGDYQAVLVLAQ